MLFERLILSVASALILLGKLVMSDCAPKEVCVGRDSFEGLSKEEILAQLNDTLCGCSRIAGNLVIDLSADKSAEVASEQLIFLNTIVEVTGYVHLKGIQVLDYLLLPWLRVIQGRSLLSGHALVIEDVTAPGGLLFPSLTQIPEGGVLQSGFRGHCSNVSWNVILSGQNVLTESSDVVCENVVGDCGSCPNSRCWSPQRESLDIQCQIMPLPHCPEGCVSGCYQPAGGNPICCDPRCLGGCHGSTNGDCYACREYYNNGVCVDECPRSLIYEAMTLRNNSEAKHIFDHFCVSVCPDGSYLQESVCVFECASGLLPSSSGVCVSATPNRKECPGLTVRDQAGITKDNVDSFKGCVVVAGHIWISDQTSTQLQRGLISQKQIDGLLSIEEIRGSLLITRFTMDSLSFLRNVKVIGSGTAALATPTGLGGVSPSEADEFAILLIGNQQLVSLDLSALETLARGDVFLSTNDQLCYVGNFARYFASSNNSQVVEEDSGLPRMDVAACIAAGKTCHSECESADGCWGPGLSHCVTCLNYEYRPLHQCVATCDEVPGTFPDEPSQTCRTCHPQCTSCTGPALGDCTSCKSNFISVEESDRLCVSECPVDHFARGNECLPCSSMCTKGDGCSGPEHFWGVRGCNSCPTVIVEYSLLPTCVTSCFSNHFTEVLTSSQNMLYASTVVCHSCHSECDGCHGPSSLDCDKCRNDVTIHSNGSTECRESCSTEFYFDGVTCKSCDARCDGCSGPTVKDCISCRNKLSTVSRGCDTECEPGKVVKDGVCVKNNTFTDMESKGGNELGVAVIAAIVVGALVVMVTTLGLLMFCVCCWRRKRKVFDVTGVVHELRPRHLVQSIPTSDLSMGEVIRQGQFTRVFRGMYRTTDGSKLSVVVKQLNQTASFKEHINKALCNMLALSHDNIVTFHGPTFKEDRPRDLVYNFEKLGALNQYLHNNAPQVSAGDMVSGALQIAKGMAHLESLGLVHGRLALHNIMVSTHFEVKISDVGMEWICKCSNDLLPVRWLPPEKWDRANEEQYLPARADVWAFGVTLWELFTYGEFPYSEWSAVQVVSEVCHEYRLPQPQICRNRLYNVMEKCWSKNNTDRPSFSNLVQQLEEMATSPDTYVNREKMLQNVAPRVDHPFPYESVNMIELDKALNGCHSPDSGCSSLEQNERLV